MASKKFAVDIDALENALLNAVMQPLAADPAPVKPAGHLYYNTVAQELRFSDGVSYSPVGSSLTAGQILSALISVDGAGSGLDADLLDGQEASAFAASSHTHTSAQITDFNTAVQAIVDGVIDGAPGALDTLNELAAALGDDPNFAATITASIATKTGKFAADIGDGASTAIAVTHSLATQDVVVSVREVATNEAVITNWVATDANNVTVTFNTAPASNEYRVTVVG